MLKIFLVFLFSFTFLSASIKNATASYDVSYGIFGVMGEAKAKIKTDKQNNYTITVKAYATGFAKVLSGGLVETYISKGRYINGKFHPDYFEKITTQKDQTKRYRYRFDYDKKTISLVYTKKYKDYHQDEVEALLNPSFDDNYVWKTKKKISTVPYWATEDILSLFFNIKHYISNSNQTTIKHIKAVGAGSKRGGVVDLIVPDTKMKSEIKELLGEDKNLLIVKIYKKIFASKNGELYLSMKNDGLCDKAVLKDVLFFGDVIGKLKN